ncbi:uncharacterized protein LOC143633230 [Bidens hawaiensis]|uniref:uncharacterized protein LOC143633230 n=1 Tax=Bidens hawaiensis TaxID=980011 RepID=UPI00404AA956
MKTPYEIVHGHKPTVARFRVFGCPCTLLNLESTPKFRAKADNCYFVGYASHTAYRVYNKSTKQILESYDVRWLEENETDARVGPDWLCDYNELFKPFNVLPVTNTDILGDAFVDAKKEAQHAVSHISLVMDDDLTEPLDATPDVTPSIYVNQPEKVTATVSSPTPSENTSTVEGESPIRQVFGSTLFPDVITSEYVTSSSYSHNTATFGWKNPLTEVDENLSNLSPTGVVPEQPIPKRTQRNHPIENVIGPLETGVSTISQTGHINSCLFSCFISQIEPYSVEMALQEPSWVDAMHEELNQFEKLKVWRLIELPKGNKALDMRWVFRNKQDDSGVIVRNKAQLVVRGFR